MPDIKKEHLVVPKTAKICQLGEFSSKTSSVWIVLHGYAQQADYFIRNFEPLVSSETVIVAPEGLSRFYRKGFYGRVGASWMTKEERLSEIEDYCKYLDILYQHILKKLPKKNVVKINVLGFSQGGATASRWAEYTSNRIDNLVLWSSVFPEDMPPDNLNKLSCKQNCLIVYGKEDEFFNTSHFEVIDKVQSNFSKIEIVTFEGGHQICSDTLKKLQDNFKL